MGKRIGMRRYLAFVVLALLTLQGCIVSKKKYDDMLAQKVKADGELAQKTDLLDKANLSIKDAEEKMTKLKSDTTDLGINYRASKQKLADLNNEYDKVNAYYKNLLNSSGKLNRD